MSIWESNLCNVELITSGGYNFRCFMLIYKAFIFSIKVNAIVTLFYFKRVIKAFFFTNFKDVCHVFRFFFQYNLGSLLFSYKKDAKLAKNAICNFKNHCENGISICACCEQENFLNFSMFRMRATVTALKLHFDA